MTDSSSGSESEDGWANIRSLVLARILDVHSSGSFATSGSFENFVLPGIFVNKIGAIRLPLSSHDAQSLIRASRQAPFGKGTQTLVDETVRKTWEIDGSEVSFSNEAWHSWLKGIVKAAAEGLGVAGGSNGVRAELYKMLLYEEGAMFKPHKDTEKTPGMFGTLVICLPSEHVGGAVRLTHCQKEKVFDTAGSSTFNTTYIAWYADVSHEIEPVQSGYRWILTYNLVKDTLSGFPQSAAGLDAQISRFCQALAEWRSLDGGLACLCYAFDHQYTNAGFNLASLKADDYHRARYIVESCEKSGDFCVLFASLQKIVTFDNDEGGEENLNSGLRLERIVDKEGFMLREYLNISEDCLLQRGLYDSRDPDSQSGGEYMGNQHAEIEQLYDDRVMLIVWKATVTNFLLGGNHSLDDFRNFLKRLQERFKMRNEDSDTRELMVQTCRKHLKRSYHDDGTRDLFLGPIAIAAIVMADQDLFRNSVRLVTNGFDVSTFFGFGELVCFLKPVFPETDFVEAVSKTRNLYQTHRCLRAFRNGFSTKNVNRSEEHQVEYMKSWVRDRVSEALKSLPQAYPEDAAVLIETAKEYDDKMFDECITPFIARFIGDSNFLNALVVELLCFSQSSSPDKDLLTRFLPLILAAAISEFELHKYSSASKNSASRDAYPYSSWPNCYKEDEKGRRDASTVASLYQQLFQLDGRKASELLDEIESQTESLPHQELDRLLIPLLQQLIPILDLRSPEVCKFYQSMMVMYIRRVVQKEPEKPKDWYRPEGEELRCYSDCSNCRSLQAFLKEPKEVSCRFVLPDNPSHFTWNVPKQCDISRVDPQKPEVVIVTKTLRGWEEDHKKWRERASKAQETFKQFPQTELQQCLAEQYAAVMDLHMVKLQNTDASTVPQKRPRSEEPHDAQPVRLWEQS
ncbi:hypothetical protein MMC30_000886 [Trapelia coarctata]|nr:hypothetical protein [Trapelia coarctata]